MYAMPLVGLLTAPLALYVRTGIPAARALLIGATNAFGSTTVVAMPSELAAIAEFSEVIIVGTVGCVEVAPVQVGVAMPSSAAASANPYWVGVKNALSVTWLMKVNFHEGVFGKFPATFFAVAALLLLPDEQAARSAAAGDPVPHVQCLDRLVDLRVDSFPHLFASRRSSSVLSATPRRGAPKSGCAAQSLGRAGGTCGVAGVQEVADTRERESAGLSGAPRFPPEVEIPQRTARTRCIARPRFDVGLPGRALCGVPAARPTHGYRAAHCASRMRCRIEPMIEAAHPCGALS